MSRSVSRTLVTVLLVCLAFGLRLALMEMLRRPARRATTVVTPTGESDGERRQRLAGIPASRKTEWVDVVPGVDLGRLPAERREVFLRRVNSEHCSCGCGFTLAACRRFDSTCDVSGPRVDALLDSVVAGLASGADGLRERPAGH
jgi:hypothetical protein